MAFDLNKYYNLINEFKESEAEKLRRDSIPTKLVKFYSLNEDDDLNGMKLNTLEKNEIWLSSIDKFNDPFEFKNLILDEALVKRYHCPDDKIIKLQQILYNKEYIVSCFTSNNISYLPMWAFYANNHKGFCVEYDVKDCPLIFQVIYLEERHKLGKFIINLINNLSKSKRGIENKFNTNLYVKILCQNYAIKSTQWKHENEYRLILYNKYYKNRVSLDDLKIKPQKIVAGLKCKKDHIDRLNQISNKLGLGNCYKTSMNEDKYELDIEQV
ncbi:MAG: DUF2971 domain-containing protein [Catenibacterium mitsuokai]|nr:DUF2971 domain-containing protein [Catenibacterium mitsuokai]MDD6594720.1 DUF2971 domain-containing protein [Catenibacterium mitsuokai]